MLGLLARAANGAMNATPSCSYMGSRNAALIALPETAKGNATRPLYFDHMQPAEKLHIEARTLLEQGRAYFAAVAYIRPKSKGWFRPKHVGWEAAIYCETTGQYFVETSFHILGAVLKCCKARNEYMTFVFTPPITDPNTIAPP